MGAEAVAIVELLKRLQIKSIEMEIEYKASETCSTADLYIETDEGLAKRLSQSQNEYQHLSTFLRACVKFFSFFGFDPIRGIEQEISYRKSNERSPDDWKKPFIQMATYFEGRGLKEVGQYVRNNLMGLYYNSRLERLAL